MTELRLVPQTHSPNDHHPRSAGCNPKISERLTKLRSSPRYGRVDLLLIDELGYINLDRRGAELLFQVLTEREETQRHLHRDERTLLESRTSRKRWRQLDLAGAQYYVLPDYVIENPRKWSERYPKYHNQHPNRARLYAQPRRLANLPHRSHDYPDVNRDNNGASRNR